jgi:hypothetical protein
MVIQLTSEETLHEHSRGAVTVTLPVPPLASREEVGVVSETWHFAGEGLVEMLEEDPQALVVIASAKPIAGYHRGRASRRRFIQSTPAYRRRSSFLTIRLDCSAER